MITIARSSDTEREVLFANAAERAGINNPAIVDHSFHPLAHIRVLRSFRNTSGTLSAR